MLLDAVIDAGPLSQIEQRRGDPHARPTRRHQIRNEASIASAGRPTGCQQVDVRLDRHRSHLLQIARFGPLPKILQGLVHAFA